MGVLTMDDHIAVAKVAGYRRANREGEARLNQARRLFDMDFNECVDRCGIDTALLAVNGIWTAAARRKMIRQSAAGIDAFGLQRPLRKRSKCRSASNVGNLKPSAFLRPDRHYLNISLRLHSQQARRCK